MSDIHPDLARWLDTATEGLSSEVAAAVRDELTAHYEDALAEYTGQGAADAHARAMADLGAADTTAQGLKDAHLGRRRYEAASVASLLTVITIFVVNFAYVLCVGKGPQARTILLLAFNLVMLPLGLWVLLTLRRLLTWRFGVPRLDRIFALGIGGLVANCIVDSVSQAVFGYSFNSGGVRSVLDLTGGFEIAVNLAALGALAAIGVSLIGIAVRIIRLEDGLYGLGKVLAVVTFVMGLCFASIGVWVTLRVEMLIAAASLTVMLAHFLLWPLATLLFFRAAYRPSLRPARFV
jgi:hypothetical protein